MAKNVAIVFEPDFSVRLEKLAFHTPVWIVDTPPNRGAAEVAWQTAVEWPHITVTLFRETEEWTALLDQIGPFDAVDVIGSPLTDLARAALEQRGFERFDETNGGFKARR